MKLNYYFFIKIAVLFFSSILGFITSFALYYISNCPIFYFISLICILFYLLKLLFFTDYDIKETSVDKLIYREKSTNYNLKLYKIIYIISIAVFVLCLIATAFLTFTLITNFSFYFAYNLIFISSVYLILIFNKYAFKHLLQAKYEYSVIKVYSLTN